ncbi:MAG: cache domain-containing protein, partial [Polyangiales bacterium]
MRKGAAAIDPLSPRPRNVRRLMLRNLILVAFATASALVAVTLWNARSTHKRVAQARIEHATTMAAQEFEGRFAPVEQGLQMAWEWGRMGLIDATHTGKVVRELTPVLRPLDKVTAAVVASDSGHEIHLAALREADGTLVGWTTRTREPSSPEARYTTMRWGPEGKPLEHETTTTELPGYDPVSRPWFRGAKDHGTAEAMFRTAPYPLFNRQEYGVSQSMRWEDADGVGTVVAFDMLLTGISAMVNEINVSERGVAFLCNSAGEVFLPSSAGPSEQLPPVFVPPEEVDNRFVANAMEAWLGDGTDDKRPVHFGSGRGAGWAGFTLLDARSQLWLGVAVPDSDIFGTP